MEHSRCRSRRGTLFQSNHMNKSPHKRLDIRSVASLQPTLFSLDVDGNLQIENTPPTEVGDSPARVVWSYDKKTRKEQAAALRAMRLIYTPTILATGSVPGKTLFDNVAPHRVNPELGESRIFYLTDIVDAYGSVQQDVMEQKVERILGSRYANGRNLRGARNVVASYIEEGAFLPGVPGLPQGNATSPDLYNWYMAHADNVLAFKIWAERNLHPRVATRYLDDLTISSTDEDGVGRSFRRSVRTIYGHFAPGMEFSHPKSRILHLNADNPITITGLSIYADGRITPSPELLTAANAVFGEMARKLAEYEEITDHDLALVAGYNGVLSMPGEARHSASELVRTMGAYAHLLIEQMKPRIQR